MNDRFDGDGVEGREEELRGVDELFAAAKEYASSARFRELMEFTGRFKKIAPYNAMLIYLQQPGAQFVLSARDWLHKFDRVVLADKRHIFHPGSQRAAEMSVRRDRYAAETGLVL